MQLFDIINNLCASKENIWGEFDSKDYKSFLVNRGLSYYLDTVMLAAEMNRRDIPSEWQYTFLHETIHPKKKRFSKWITPETDETLEMIMNLYQVNRHRAASIRSLLSDKEINTLRETTNLGGRNNENKKQ